MTDSVTDSSRPVRRLARAAPRRPARRDHDHRRQPPARGRQGALRRNRPATGGRRDRQAAPGAAPHRAPRGRDDRHRADARRAAGLDQRGPRGRRRPDAHQRHRHLPDGPARLLRLRLHRRRAGRPVRQRQHQHRRRPREADGPAARPGRRQRHRVDVQPGRGRHPARAAPLRRAGRLRHQPRLPDRRHQPARQRAAARRPALGGHRPCPARLHARHSPDEGARAADRRDASTRSQAATGFELLVHDQLDRAAAGRGRRARAAAPPRRRSATRAAEEASR